MKRYLRFSIFTLIELLVVTAIIAIFAAMFLPVLHPDNCALKLDHVVTPSQKICSADNCYTSLYNVILNQNNRSCRNTSAPGTNGIMSGFRFCHANRANILHINSHVSPGDVCFHLHTFEQIFSRKIPYRL